ncbi:MAG: hypothetical protein GTO02_11465 [Candidatus Dadabacteria bacterium]|nr:hypothetical protein [Candidatus Dadabacteria bacterium]NIQ14975.1 hypothetical protein [Candidatus Dadabacteria bacterium]
MRYKNLYLNIKNWFFRETFAIPLDIFRILAGVLSVFYFYALLTQVKDFSSPEGIINHSFFIENWQYLKLNLIQPGVGESFFYIILGIGLIASFSLIAGFKPRICAFLLFIISTSVQRWNFAVIYVDDATMHLLFFWLILLPTGKTLVLSEYLKEGSKILDNWKETKISSFVINCLIINICWLYLFAGLTKLVSPMWYQGFAMYPIMQIPIARFPDFWKPDHYNFLIVVTYASLITEIALPFLLLTAKNSLTKKLGLISQILFHVGIITILRIPFANIALAASAVLFFREEIMEFLFQKKSDISDLRHKFSFVPIFSLIIVLLICISTMRNVPLVKHVARPVTSALWLIGINQHYQLFDWIHRFNFKIERKVGIVPLGLRKQREIKHTDFFPNDVRFILFQLRNYDIRWILHIGKDVVDELKEDIRNGIAKKYCKKINRDGEVNIITTLHRITPDNIYFTKEPKVFDLSFTCYQGKHLTAKEYLLNPSDY